MRSAECGVRSAACRVRRAGRNMGDIGFSTGTGERLTPLD
ncbi:hypothetical protein FM119_03345 [Mycetocola reblochoni REB411]|uniref:Uncharacterized protein n=1 Tax=Mycetocola reblochoni REB411 TaxID=1255698 RepID=A0A1R4ISN4_9MICO|nr:hypothetical protein FM119_03345 [Mycetocola reblochoni REB411]